MLLCRNAITKDNLALWIACEDEQATYFGKWTEDLIVSSCRVAFSSNSRTHMFQMWQFGQATTLTQRCWENVNTGQSIKVVKLVCTGFKRVHLMTWCEFALRAEQTGHIATSRTQVAWRDGPSLVWRREKIANPKFRQVSLYFSVIGTSEHHYAKGDMWGREEQHDTLPKDINRLIWYNLCHVHRCIFDVNSVFQEIT